MTALSKETVPIFIAQYYADFGFSWPEEVDLSDFISSWHGFERIELFALRDILEELRREGTIGFISERHRIKIALILKPEQIDWWHEFANVKALGRWLCNEIAFEGVQLQAYYEKPHSWDEQYAAFLSWKETRETIDDVVATDAAQAVAEQTVRAG
jgi:hypothetical protein